MGTEDKRISSEQMAAIFRCLSQKEQERLYYMMQGAVLLEYNAPGVCRECIHNASDSE